MAALDQLTGLMSALQAVQGSSTQQTQTTSGGRQTQQTQLSDAAVQEQIQRILAGPGGVRDIGGAARRSGLYNSTTEELLLGNLYATAAAQGEIARAPTVTTTAPQTTTTQQETPGVGILPVLGTIAGGAVLNRLFQAGGDELGNQISNLLPTSFGSGTSGSLEGLTGGVNFGPGNFGLSAGLTEAGGAGDFQGDSFGFQLGQSLPGIGSGSVGTSGIGGARRTDNEPDLLGSVGNALSGFFSGGGLGGLVGAITGGAMGNVGSGGGGSSAGTSGGSVICTALMEKGELDEKLYTKGAAYLEQLDPLTKAGYHVWARSIAAKIRGGSKVATAICRPFARSRTALLASNGTFWDHVKFPLGTLTKFVGEPICHFVGWGLVTLALRADLAGCK